MTRASSLAARRADHQEARYPFAPLPRPACTPDAGGHYGRRSGRHNVGDTGSWRGRPLAGCRAPFTAGESWLTMKAAEHPPAGPTAQPHCHLIAHHESQATIQATNFVMPKQSSALPGRKAAVGATRAGDGTGSGNPVGTAPLAPSAGGVLEAWMLGPQDSPVLVIGALAVLRLAWGFVACGSNGSDARLPSQSWTSCWRGSASARSLTARNPKAKDSRRPSRRCWASPGASDPAGSAWQLRLLPICCPRRAIRGWSTAEAPSDLGWS